MVVKNLRFMFMLLLSLFVTTTLAQTTQTCLSHNFTNNEKFTTCRDLPELSSYLHWTFDQTTGKLDIAFRHTGISSNDRWVSWAINPNNDLTSSMTGAQALVAIPQSSGAPKAYTSSIAGYGTQLTESAISYNHSKLSATHANGEVAIFATITLSSGVTSLVHLWQDGPVSGGSPQSHATSGANVLSKEKLDLLSGVSQAGSGGGSLSRRRNTHGILNAVSWGILMPLGAVIARYLKVFKSADPAWFYLHVTCQTAAYIVGVAGWGTGLKLGSDSAGITYSTHRALGITLFCLGTLQVFALLLRPNKDHKIRVYWNFYHWAIGYATIIISIINIFKGFDALEVSAANRYDNWKHAYTGIIAALGGIAVLLEAYTWIIVIKRKKSQNKLSHGTNGTNGYGQQV
ncbi:cytochrome b561 and DOMON domain-containing protein At5g47530-like [Vicia villosa]|uniref:cytochrome b561 and DOMON domain-containing protein At5g47530-like n=1 Tax=Vicia villosa TaxID=3911 RepID=UPI00273ADEFB|nr:cytochrome b561 and DOMON domain-containing protein At5g47530-like [Vicia villosa]